MDNPLSAETEAPFDGQSALMDAPTLDEAEPLPGADAERGRPEVSVGRRLATRRDKLEALGLLIGILGILLLATATIGSGPHVGP